VLLTRCTIRAAKAIASSAETPTQRRGIDLAKRCRMSLRLANTAVAFRRTAKMGPCASTCRPSAWTPCRATRWHRAGTLVDLAIDPASQARRG
jgi:hypothetical protein